VANVKIVHLLEKVDDKGFAEPGKALLVRKSADG